MPSQTKEQAERAARDMLKSVWGHRFPVDPVRIARQLGIDVLDARLASNVAGALVKEVGQDPTILLNASDSPNRKRFTCAHELGHFVRRSERPDEYEYVDERGSLASSGTDPEEIYANTFAAALLMPEEEVRRLAQEGHTPIHIALYFDVSAEALQLRLENLGVGAAA